MTATIIREAVTVELNWETWQVHKQGCTGNAKSYREAVKGHGSFTTYRDWRDATDTIPNILWRDDIKSYIDDCGDYIAVDAANLNVDPRAIVDGFVCRCLSFLPWKPEAPKAERKIWHYGKVIDSPTQRA